MLVDIFVILSFFAVFYAENTCWEGCGINICKLQWNKPFVLLINFMFYFYF